MTCCYKNGMNGLSTAQVRQKTLTNRINNWVETQISAILSDIPKSFDSQSLAIEHLHRILKRNLTKLLF